MKRILENEYRNRIYANDGEVYFYNPHDILIYDEKGHAIHRAYPMDQDGEYGPDKTNPTAIKIMRNGSAEVADSDFYQLLAQGYQIANPKVFQQKQAGVVYLYHHEKNLLKNDPSNHSRIYAAYAMLPDESLESLHPVVEIEVQGHQHTYFRHKLANPTTFNQPQGLASESILKIDINDQNLYQAIMNLEKAGLMPENYQGSVEDFMKEYQRKAVAINILAEASKLNVDSLQRLNTHDKRISKEETSHVSSQLQNYAQKMIKTLNKIEHAPPDAKMIAALSKIGNADEFAIKLLTLDQKELNLLSMYLFMTTDTASVARGHKQIMIAQLMQSVAYHQLIQHADEIRGRADKKGEAIDQVKIAMETALKTGDVQQCVNAMADLKDTLTLHSSGKATAGAFVFRLLSGNKKYESTSARYVDEIMQKLIESNGGQGPTPQPQQPALQWCKHQ